MTTRDKMAQVSTIMIGDAVKMVVKKATTRIDAPPKRKHVQTLSYYIKNQRANFPHLIDCLSARFRKTNWLISMKSLLTVHLLLINAESDNFIAYISTRSSIFELAGYVDRSSLYAVEMSVNVTSYSKFLLSKCDAFRYIGKDISNKDAEKFTFDAEKIFKEMELINVMLTNILDNNVSFHHTSSIIQSVHMFLAKELLRVFSAFNKRMVFLLENMNDLEAKDATKLIEFHRILVSVNDPIQEIITQASTNGLGELAGIKIAKPSESLVGSIESYVLDIVRARGSRLLKQKWLPDYENESQTTTTHNPPIISSSRMVSLDFDPSPHVDLLEKKYDPSSSSVQLDMIDFNSGPVKTNSVSLDSCSDSISTSYNFVNSAVPSSPTMLKSNTGMNDVHMIQKQSQSFESDKYTNRKGIPCRDSTPIPEDEPTLDSMIQNNLLFDGQENMKPLKWEAPNITEFNSMGYSSTAGQSNAPSISQYSVDQNKRRSANTNNPFF